MENKKSLVAQTIGWICLWIGLLGVFILSCGLVLMIGGIIMHDTRSDATGLWILWIPPIILKGAVLSCLIIPAAYFFKLRPRILFITILFVALLPVFIGNQILSKNASKVKDYARERNK